MSRQKSQSCKKQLVLQHAWGVENVPNTPRIAFRPNILDMKMPNVMKSWWTVPKAPRRLYGVISVRNMGAKQLPMPAAAVPLTYHKTGTLFIWFYAKEQMKNQLNIKLEGRVQRDMPCSQEDKTTQYKRGTHVEPSEKKET